ncbi:nicotinamide-nucleotide adenylyltransferase [Physcia stellaris]|nr:nicotinamide-nucleotide adenylyltransferase [Physcia stellaris]
MDIKPHGQEPVGELKNYKFSESKIKRSTDTGKQPIVLVACGSFSPVTFLHLRMFEIALDHVRFALTDYDVIGMYLSPVSDSYKKQGLAPAPARIEMCQLAVEGSNVQVDPWEALQSKYTPTADVLDHFENELNGSADSERDGAKPQIRACLLAGSDLLDTMKTPGVWSKVDLDRILSRGVFVIERPGTDESDALAALSQWKEKIYLVPQLIPNEISSTRVRLSLKRGLSVNYLVPKNVVAYIEEHGLYRDESKRKDISGENPSSIEGSGSSSR